MGYEVPDEVPGFAWVHKDSVKLECKFMEDNPDQIFSFGLGLELEFTEPFQLADVIFTVVKKVT